MLKRLVATFFAVAALPAAAAAADISQTIAGTRLDVVATSDVTRTPDVAIISAGVVSRSTTASGALQDTATRMARVLAALKREGTQDRDIQTSNVSLNPEYRYENNQPPQLVGYSATNTVTVRFRDIRSSGSILDALVAQGANQINGPTLTIDKPEQALDEARAKAIALGRSRAELYARALGQRIVRVVSVSEGEENPGGPQPLVITGARLQSAKTDIEPGEQHLRVSVAMTFELQ